MPLHRVRLLLLLALSVLMLLLMPSLSQAVDEHTPGWFPWTVPSLEPLEANIDLSSLNTEIRPIEIRDGHFADAQGQRIRFFGTNLIFDAACPPKDIAPKLAAHLRQLGFNLIRFHHLDTGISPRGIVREDKTFDWEQVDRLEFLISELEKNGIYVNMNLHVGGRFYPDLPAGVDMPLNMGKTFDQFYPPLVERQKEYAKTLLTHKNPYTGKTLAEDPGVLVVEITNEDSLFWPTVDQLRTMPEPYCTSLTEKWRAWLTTRYPDDSALRAAWSKSLEGPGPELLTNGDFSAGLDNWTPVEADPKLATVTAEPDGENENAKLVKVLITAPAKTMDVLLQQASLTLQDAKPYTLSFDAQSPTSSTLRIGARVSQAPSPFVGLNRKVALLPEWKHFDYTFVPFGSEGKPCQIVFTFGHTPAEWSIRNVSLRRGTASSEAERMKTATRDTVGIPLPSAGTAEIRDFHVFLFETECATANEIRDYLKNTLHVRAHIVDTQAGYGGFPSLYREAANMDVVDMHAYWQHPNFYNKQWDLADWRVQNTPMSSDAKGGTLANLARHRVLGKPYTISEYNHSAPSFYMLEMFPMLASFGSFQDWDAIYQFTYLNDGKQWASESIQTFFGLDGNSGQLAFVPFAAIAFRSGAFTTDAAPSVLKVPASPLEFLEKQAVWDVDAVWQKHGGTAAYIAENPVAIELDESTDKPTLQKSDREAETPAIHWKMGANGVYQAVSETAVALVGAVAKNKKPHQLGPIEITFNSTSNGHACFTAVALDGRPLTESNKVLITLGNRVENTGMIWQQNDRSVGKDWGEAPMRAEGISAAIRVNASPRQVHALKGNGALGAPIATAADSATFEFQTDPTQQTMWYLITNPTSEKDSNR